MSDNKVVSIFAAREPDAVLDAAKDTFESVLIIGYKSDGELEFRSTLNLNEKELNWMIEQLKASLIAGDFAENEHG